MLGDLYAAVTAAAEFEEAMAKVNAVFESTDDEIASWVESIKRSAHDSR